MRIIDERGRLFGKINIIDFLVILFLFCLAPMFYFGYKIFHKPQQPMIIQNLITLDLYCRIINLTPDTLKLISVGDIFLDESGNNIGEILNIGEPTIYSYTVDLGGGNIISYQDPSRRQVLIKARVLGKIINDAFYYKGEKISIGSKVNLKTNEYSIEGLIESEPKSMIRQKILVKVRFKDLISEVANIINIGDKERGKMKDIISEVKSIINNKPADVFIPVVEQKKTGEGLIEQIKIAEHPLNRDIELLIEVECTKKDGLLLFKDGVLKVGNSFTFNTDKYDIIGTVVGME